VIGTSSANAVSSEELQERIDWWLEESGDELVLASHLLVCDSTKSIGSTFVIEAEDIEIPPPLISFARLLLLSREDWEKVKQRQKLPKPKLSEEDGSNVLDVINQGLQHRLNQFPSTVEVRAPGLWSE
jgi:SET domain-containing protein 6